MIMNMDPQPDAYAGWVVPLMVLKVDRAMHIRFCVLMSLGNNWYQYTFLDMGIKCTNKVKVIKVGNKLLFDEIKQGKI